MYFNCVNTVTMYNAEIAPFTDPYTFDIELQTIGSLGNCVFGIFASIWIGKYLDKTKQFKRL